jgi:hypothetical protein
MPVRTIRPSLRQVGRIRIGASLPTASGALRPAKLQTFRLSAPQREPIDAAAELWGGVVDEMSHQKSVDKWQVITRTSSIPVMIPPQNAIDQWYESWGAGGCDRRCDGEEMIVADGRSVTELPCMCDPDERVCKLTTRLFLVLPDLPALGVWRLESHGYYAAVELSAVMELCLRAAARGISLPATLDLEHRQVTRASKTWLYSVPTLNVATSVPEMQAILRGGDPATGELPPAAVAALSQPVDVEVVQPPPRELGVADPGEDPSWTETSQWTAGDWRTWASEQGVTLASLARAHGIRSYDDLAVGTPELHRSVLARQAEQIA